MMNIQAAKDQIKDTVDAYLQKDDAGMYIIHPSRQRPMFLVGAPGIGKTAIIEQIAQELGIGVVSYSMTHHTRQSALGLPRIVHCEFEGFEYEASEYTMSEIVSSVYDYMERTGLRRGILFLDEINCVSETLYPSMLQFLQFKTFGRHRVPKDWIIVCAGNPPEYNKSVHEFDIVTLDRLREIDVEPDRIDDIRGDLVENRRVLEEDKDGGAYDCSYPSFIDAYHIMSRNMARTGDSVYMMLCTLVDYEGKIIRNEEKRSNRSESLATAIQAALRQGDVFCKYNVSQYLILLSGTSREDCDIVYRRIQDKLKELAGSRAELKYSVVSLADLEKPEYRS